MHPVSQRPSARALAIVWLVLPLLATLVPAEATARTAPTAESAPASRSWLATAPAAAQPAGNAEIIYRKIFKTSYPEFVEIKINESGSGTYDIRQLDEEANPQPFEIGAPLAQRIFSLAAKLHHFQGVDLDVHRRLANLGEKTLQYENGAEKHETKFNYTLDDSASQMVNIFEGLARQTSDISDLVRTMRYDRLGVNDVLLQIESDLNNKLIPEPERLLPTLDQLAGDDKFIEIARQRARTLAGHIRSAH
jgi:hypothetical protein